MLRRRLKNNVVAETRDANDQLHLSFAEVEEDTPIWEHAVLVTSLDLTGIDTAGADREPGNDIRSIAQLYRDRADCENVFDELKNQWGWGGFTTKDLARCRLTARMVALVYNWWNIFVRLGQNPTSIWRRSPAARCCSPALGTRVQGPAIAERTRHGRQTTLRIASTHLREGAKQMGRAGWAERVLTGVASFMR